MEMKNYKADIPTEIVDFIQQSTDSNVQQLALKKNPFPYFDWKWIINQIAARQKAKTKLPTWYNHTQTIFPSLVSVEQTSSEAIAQYKSQLFSGKKLIDLTGGLGVDTYYFAQQFEEVIHCEWNEDLSQIAAYNFQLLGAKNIQCVVGDSLEYLAQTTQTFDCIYVDPARRDEHKNKVFLFEDCTPNITTSKNLFLQKANKVIVKTSPMVDIFDGISQLKSVNKIYVLAYKNEVKELLWVLEKESKIIEISAVNITPEKVVEFTHILDERECVNISLPMKYLYEPFSAVLKTGLFNRLAAVFPVDKLHRHSHLYTSEEKTDFPGRVFKINEIFPFSKKEIKKQLEGKKMNVTTRNFHLSVEELRKKYKIKDGGDIYAFFTTNKNDEKIVILTEKI